jgi:4-hydroxythreonine-4-phosphate dehydrogenase
MDAPSISSIALTMGDPAGIGGEITAGAWRTLRATGPHFVAVADPDWLANYAPIQTITRMEEADFTHNLPVIPIHLATTAIPGAPDTANAAAIIASIEQAVRLAQSGAASAIVTNPIAKSVLQSAGFPHPGHTEFLAALTGRVGREVMMLAAPALRVVPVTIHVSLRRSLDELTTDAIVNAARITHTALISDFGIARPRLAIAGLNPHAGESGRMGTEEITLIQPAIDLLRAENMIVTGPHPPDTMFTESARRNYDVAICMYHDQALIPLKTLDVFGGVNITLGLPIVRTSPDHGTAFDIAGKGIADPASLIAALEMAAQIANQRRLT